MMRISWGTYYSGSWSSTACILLISLHPSLELNPSSPGAGRPTHQPLGLWNNDISDVAWVTYRIHPQTHNKSVRSVQKIEGTGGGVAKKNPFLIAGKINPSLSCYTICFNQHQIHLKLP